MSIPNPNVSTVQQQLVTTRYYANSGTNGRTDITIHETDNNNAGAGAQAHANLQSQNNSGPSGFEAAWHYQVDDTRVIQSYPHAVQCWHAGTQFGNNNAIAIEICVNSDSNYDQALANAAWLVRRIQGQEGISRDRVRQHNFYSGKHCPRRIRDGGRWSEFLAATSRSGNTGGGGSGGGDGDGEDNPTPRGWTRDATLLTIKAIGTVESELNYQAINFSDPITVGVAQWYGVRAAAILARMRTADPSGWQSVAPSLRNDMENWPASSSYWNSRYLTPAEGSSLRQLLLNNKDIQNAQFSDDIDGYVSVMRNLRFRVDDQVQAAIFFASMYHQSPQSALQVLNTVGLNPTLDQIHRGALNHSVLGRYRNRQDTVKRIIEAGDLTGVTDPGGEPVEDDENAGGSPSPPIAEPSLTHVTRSGDALHIHRKDGPTIVAVPATAQRWLMGRDRGVGAPGAPEPNEPGGGTGGGTGGGPGGGDDGGGDGGSGGDGDATDAIAWARAREGTLRYSQGPGRTDPDRTGVADCSSMLQRAYLDSYGINIGGWTGEQRKRGRLIASGSAGQRPSASLIKPGDLLFSNQPSEHVEMFTSANVTIGMRVSGLIESSITWQYGVSNWSIRRYV